MKKFKVGYDTIDHVWDAIDDSVAVSWGSADYQVISMPALRGSDGSFNVRGDQALWIVYAGNGIATPLGESFVKDLFSFRGMVG